MADETFKAPSPPQVNKKSKLGRQTNAISTITRLPSSTDLKKPPKAKYKSILSGIVADTTLNEGPKQEYGTVEQVARKFVKEPPKAKYKNILSGLIANITPNEGPKQEYGTVEQVARKFVDSIVGISEELCTKILDVEAQGGDISEEEIPEINPKKKSVYDLKGTRHFACSGAVGRINFSNRGISGPLKK